MMLRCNLVIRWTGSRVERMILMKPAALRAMEVGRRSYLTTSGTPYTRQGKLRFSIRDMKASRVSIAFGLLFDGSGAGLGHTTLPLCIMISYVQLCNQHASFIHTASKAWCAGSWPAILLNNETRAAYVLLILLVKGRSHYVDIVLTI